MRRTAIFGLLLLIPVVLVLAATPGCSKKKDTTEEKKTAETKKEVDDDKKPAADKKPLEANLDGVIKGKVTFDGTPPEPEMIPALKDSKNKACLVGATDREKIMQMWLVNSENKGVANVVVWLAPPAGKYFQLADEDKDRKNQVISLNQPHCAFIPHVVAAYPSYYDGKTKKRVPTGQVFQTTNKYSTVHNTRLSGTKNSGNNVIAPQSVKKIPLEWESKPVKISCDVHSWMTGTLWIFDHPYHAVTDNDGNFEIKNVPTGVELTVIGWHEAKDRFWDKKKEFTKGDNAYDMTISK